MANIGLPWNLASAGYSIQPVNGEFSAWSQGVNVPPDGWTVQSGTWGSSLSQCQGALGPYAVDFGAASGVGALTSEDIAVMPATKYLLSGYYRVVTASGATNSQGLRVDWYDDSRALIQSDYVDCAATTSGAWTAKGSEITSPNAAVYARVLCGRFNVQGSADFQLDSVKFDRAIYIPTGSISMDSVVDGPTTYGRTMLDGLNGGYPFKVWRDSGALDVSNLFKRGSDTLDDVLNSANYGRVNLTALSSGNPKTDSLVDGLFSKVASGYVDGTTKAITNIYNGTASVSGSVLFNKSADNLSNVADGGGYGKVLSDHLTSGAITSITRGGTKYASTTFFNTGLDNLGAITDGGGFAKVNSTAVSGGNPKTDSLVDGTYSKVAATYVDGTSKAITTIRNTALGVDIAGSSVFRKGTDTFANVAGTLSDGQLGSNVVNASNIKNTAVTSVYRPSTTTVVAAESLFKKVNTTDPDTLDGITDGSVYGRPKLDGLNASGYPLLDKVVDGTLFRRVGVGYVNTSGQITAIRNTSGIGADIPGTAVFSKSADTLDNVAEGALYGKVNLGSLSGGNFKTDNLVDGTYRKVHSTYVDASNRITTVYSAAGDIAGSAIFRKGTDTFANVAGTLSDGQLGANVVNTSNIKDLVVGAAELNDGIALSAYDEVTPQGIADRGSVTNCTKTSWDGVAGYIRFTIASGVTTPQITTGLYTGTSTALTTTTAVMRYRFSGGAIGVINKLTAVNTANTAQNADAVFLADGNWHTAVWDISAWTTSGTLRIDPIASSMPSIGYLDIAYIGTGVPASGTGALVSYQGSVGVGISAPASKLAVAGRIESITGGFKYPDAQIATTIPALVYRVAGSDFSTTSTSLVDITGLVTGALATNTAYLFEAYVPWRSSVISAGAQFGIASTSATLLNWTLDYITTQAAAANLQCIHAVALDTAYGPTTSGAANTTYIARIKGTLLTAGTGSPTIAIQVMASSAATIKAMIGSHLLVRKATT